MSTSNRTSGPIVYALTAALSLGLAVLSTAAEKTIALKDAPAAVQKTIADQLKGGKLRGLTVEVEDGRTEYEAELTVDGHEKDLVIDASGKVLEVEAAIELSALPEAARAGLTHEAGKGKIAKVEEITRSGAVSYEGLIKEAGKKDREVEVGPDGKLVPGKK